MSLRARRLLLPVSAILLALFAPAVRTAAGQASQPASGQASGPLAGQASGPLAGQARAAVLLHVAAAADLQPVLPALAAAYEKQTGVKLEASFGSSSALATQILNGAPMDVFLGADFSFPEKVVAAGLADEAAPVPYAKGTLVVWTRKDSGLQPISIDRLSEAKVTRIAVADQFRAPYGRAAFAAMDSMKLTEKLKAKLVMAENVAQAAQFAESGNAQAAFISLTLASTPHMREIGSYDRVPKVYPEISQCGIVMKHSTNLTEAKRFLDWLISADVQEHLAQFGLDGVK